MSINNNKNKRFRNVFFNFAKIFTHSMFPKFQFSSVPVLVPIFNKL